MMRKQSEIKWDCFDEDTLTIIELSLQRDLDASPDGKERLTIKALLKEIRCFKQRKQTG